MKKKFPSNSQQPFATSSSKHIRNLGVSCLNNCILLQEYLVLSDPFGTLQGRSLDTEGCEICECRVDGECSKPRCTNLCPYGREIDQDGCERCSCLQDPCKVGKNQGV